MLSGLLKMRLASYLAKMVMLTMPRLRYGSGNMSIVSNRYIHLTGGCLSKNSCFVLTHFFLAAPTW